MDTVTAPNMPERWSDTKDANEEIQNLCKLVRFSFILLHHSSQPLQHNSLTYISSWMNITFYFIHVQVKSHAEEDTNEKYSVFKAVKYRKQTVAGVNYIMKVKTGGKNYIHLFVFHKLEIYGGNVMLLGVQKDKKRDQPLESF
ncbi:Cystatin-B [Nibea albiflora]|uniref:Cystatin-B n=1 Tax=Nibea albiflora TaxID=240163 RepID=A0ACB7F5K4_NIBAL|nr:Cystatin-B [Nibea albiflora]